MVLLDTYLSIIDAEIVSTFLESNGIKTFIKSDDFGGMGPNLAFVRGVKLLVRKEDEENARQLISDGGEE